MAFGVTVDFNANVAKFDKSVNKLSGNLDKFGKKTESAFTLARKSVVAFGGVLAGIQFASFLKSSIEAGDRMQKLSIRLGASTEALSELQHVAALSDVSFNTLTMGLQRMTRRVSEAANGTGEAVAALDELGISAERLEKLRPEDQFEALAESISQVEGPADRVRLAMKLFDSEGVSLLQTMTRGAAGIREMREEANRLGLTISQDVADEMAAFDDNLTRLTSSTSKYGILLSGPLVTGFNKFIEVVENATESVFSFNTVMEGISDFVFDNQSFSGVAKSIADINDKIVAQKEKISVLKNEGGLGGLIDGLLGYDIGEERRKLDVLLRERQSILEEFKRKTDEQNGGAQEKAVFLDAGETNSNSKGLSSKPAKALPSLDTGKTSQSLEQATGPASEWNKLLSEAESIIAATQTPLENLNSEIELYTTLADRGLITQETLNRALTDAGENFNQLTDDVTFATDEMTVFADQAARNMQDSFSDFLFDPFEDGLGGMVDGFLNTMRQMAAELASQQIFKLIGQSLSGVGGAGGILGGLFADGGVMTPAGPMPLKRYASGGIASSPQLALFGEGASNEAYVPLPDGRSIPVTMSGGNSGGNQYNITVNVTSKEGDSASQTGQKTAEAMTRAIARQEIKSASRPGNQLNPSTKFV